VQNAEIVKITCICTLWEG